MASVKDFLDKGNSIAVVGVSANPEKWGYKLYKKLKNAGFRTYPINPKHSKIDGNQCFPDIKSLPARPDVVFSVTQPKVTELVVRQCKELGIKRVWMQPGSESRAAIAFCTEHGIDVVHNMCCIAAGGVGQNVR